MATCTRAREPLICHRCKVPMDSLAIHTDVPGAQAVVVGKCPGCDYRRCSIESCRSIVRDPMSRTCPSGHVL